MKFTGTEKGVCSFRNEKFQLSCSLHCGYGMFSFSFHNKVLRQSNAQEVKASAHVLLPHYPLCFLKSFHYLISLIILFLLSSPSIFHSNNCLCSSCVSIPGLQKCSHPHIPQLLSSSSSPPPTLLYFTSTPRSFSSFPPSSSCLHVIKPSARPCTKTCKRASVLGEICLWH